MLRYVTQDKFVAMYSALRYVTLRYVTQDKVWHCTMR